jgi:hypothetical protein
MNCMYIVLFMCSSALYGHEQGMSAGTSSPIPWAMCVPGDTWTTQMAAATQAACTAVTRAHPASLCCRHII